MYIKEFIRESSMAKKGLTSQMTTTFHQKYPALKGKL